VPAHRSPRIYQLGESGGGQVILGAVATPVTFDTEAVALLGVTLSAANLLTFAAPALGTWKVSYHLDARCSSNNRTSFEAFLVRNGTELPFTRGGLYLRNNSSLSTGSGSTFVTLGNTDTLQLQAVRFSGGGSLVVRPNGASLMLERIE
jgi:hypothetical protein